MSRPASLVAAALTLTLVACAQSTGPAGALSSAEAQFLAEALDASATSALDALFAAGGPAAAPAQTVTWTSSTSFERVRECPEGGTLTLAGTLSRHWDGEAVTYDVAGSGTKTRAACAFARNEVVFTIDGVTDWTHERHYAQRAPAGVWTTTHEGEFDWSKSTGEAGSCGLDLTRTLDVAAKTFRLEGDFCDVEISRTHTWGDA